MTPRDAARLCAVRSASLRPPAGAAALASAAPVQRADLMDALADVELDLLVMIAATAIVSAERGHRFCASCGARVSFRHSTACLIAEPGDDVLIDDAPDVEDLVARKVGELRGGLE